MNVYDFDDTIYDGDSTKDFYWYCLQNRWSLARYWPRQAWALLLYRLGRIDKTQCKQRFYVFFQGLPDMENFVYDFWRRNIKKIKHFYKVWQRPDDLIISASPAFLLEEACRRLGVVNLIASPVDPQTGHYQGSNCYGEEKVRRFRADYPHKEIEGFYSDSLSDGPMAAIAKKSYLVAGETLLPWGSQPPAAAKKPGWLQHFFSRQFALFFVIGLINAVNGVIFSLLYSLILPVSPAFVAGYLSSLTVSYLLNSRFTFRKSLSFKRYGSFCLSYLPNFAIQNIIVFVVYYWAGFSKLLAFLLAAAIGMPVTFLMLKLITFRQKG